ncbi:MAG: hypothetical protein IR527_02115 [Bacteroides sp.]|nr:MAG: hypothetical protein IR527_02115 [Bacteroides sp.]
MIINNYINLIYYIIISLLLISFMTLITDKKYIKYILILSILNCIYIIIIYINYHIFYNLIDIINNVFICNFLKTFHINSNIIFHFNQPLLSIILLILFVYTMVNIYNLIYIRDINNVKIYLFLINLFVVNMILFCVIIDIIFLYVIWEIIGIISYFIIGLNKKFTMPSITIFVINKIGGMCILMSVLIISDYYDTSYLNNIISNDKKLSFLLLTSAFTKLAQWPFNRWIIHAMNAPIYVSAFIHSTTILLLGILITIKSYHLLDINFSQFYYVAMLTITNIFCFYKLFREYNIKIILAYLTIVQYGLIMMLVLLNEIQLAVNCIVLHALYKYAFFLFLQLINNNTLDIRYIKFSNKYLYIILISLILSMGGMPFLNSFYIKNIILYSLFYKKNMSLCKIIYIINILLTYLFISIICSKVFAILIRLLNKKTEKYKNNYYFHFILLFINYIYLYFYNIFCYQYFKIDNIFISIYTYILIPMAILISYIYYYFYFKSFKEKNDNKNNYNKWRNLVCQIKNFNKKINFYKSIFHEFFKKKQNMISYIFLYKIHGKMIYICSSKTLYKYIKNINSNIISNIFQDNINPIFISFIFLIIIYIITNF